MPQVVVQTMFKPNPGADMMKLMDLVKESAAIFKRHGADVSVWAVSGGEIGNMVFAARYDSVSFAAVHPLLGRYLPAWYLGRYPDRYVIYASYSTQQARHYGQLARDVFAAL